MALSVSSPAVVPAASESSVASPAGENRSTKAALWPRYTALFLGRCFERGKVILSKGESSPVPVDFRYTQGLVGGSKEMGPDFLVHIWKSATKCWAGGSHLHTDVQDLLGTSSGDDHVVHCNNPALNVPFRYADNRTWTTKYTWYSFLPRSLFEQYRRAAYWYFTAMAALSLTPFSPYRPVSVILPLLFVIALGMARELWEDVRRARGDREINSRPVICCTGGNVHEKKWRELQVGDVVKVKDKEYFPADLLLLSSSSSDGVCYVETKNLDGETNLKVRQALECTCQLTNESNFKDFEAVVKCDAPNASLYTFTGVLEYPDGQSFPVGPSQILLRDSSLQNTVHVYGVVIYAGNDTKVMRNAIPPPSKRSRIDQSLDGIMWVMFGILFVMSLVTGLVAGIIASTRISKMYYLRPREDNPYFNPNRAAVAGIIAFVNGLVLYGYLVPISLYVTLEIVRVLQAFFIGRDLAMYDEETDRPAKVKSSGLNEELGQVDTILSDKTGTLTCNQMDFCRCTIRGVSYGKGTTEVEKAVKNLGMPLHGAKQPDSDGDDSHMNGLSADDSVPKAVVKGFNFYDERLMNGNWLKETNADEVRLFLQTLALCHTAVPEGDVSDPASMEYRAESPDETALVIAAKQFGFIFFKRTPSALQVRERTGTTEGDFVDRTYKLLNVLEFSSARRRMSVIVRFPEGKILLLSKGADSVMLERLVSHNDSEVRRQTVHHLRSYGEVGLRTLLFAYRELQPAEYEQWQSRYSKAQTVIGKEREAKIEELEDEIERGLRLLGGTGVEDKLQEGVPECIERLARAGIKIWVLTGDKVETAINIGYACSLLRPGMEKIIISLIGTSVQAIDEKLAQSSLSPEERANKRAQELESLVRHQLDDGLRLFETDVELDHFPLEDPGNGTLSSNRSSEGSGRFSVRRSMENEDGPTLRTSGSRSLQRSISKDKRNYRKMDRARDSYALVIDGDSLAVVLSGELQKPFLELSMKCSSVLCCRVSPKQKALVTNLVKRGLGRNKLCLAIGDGANDVGMIQVANVGVGIVGVEGAQAAMAADYAIGKFRFLERLLLVHGHWCYRRISVMIRYFLFKICLIGWLSFYSNIFSLFSGYPLYDDWYASFYSTLFTAWPAGIVGTLDQDVSAKDLVKYPQLYQAGQRREFFNKRLIFLAIAHSVYASLIVFFFPVALFLLSAFRSDGQPAALQDFGAALFTGLVLVPNLQLFTYVRHFTWIHHLAIWGSILSWFLFVIVYGSLSPALSAQAFREFVEALAPTPSYWLLQLVVVVVAILPDFIVRSFQWAFRPSDFQLVLEMAKYGNRGQVGTT